MKLTEKFGDIILLKILNESIYLINDAEIIKHILKTNYPNYTRERSIRDLEPLIGKSFFLAEHERWKEQSKVIKPAYHISQIEKFNIILIEETLEFINHLENISSKKIIINLEEELKNLLLIISLRNLYADKKDYDTKAVIKALDDIFSYLSYFNRNIKLIKQYLFSSGNPEIKYKGKAKEGLELIENLADDTINKVLNDRIIPAPLLEILINEFKRNAMSIEQVRDELKTIIFAGFDTVASGLTWTIYFQSIYPEVANKILNEISTIKNEDELFLKLNDNIYTQSAIKETLRIYPPAWAFYRYIINDDLINNIKMPAKSFLMISPYLIHRNKKYWSEPETYKPERFINEEINQFAYLPFGQGPHICIGNKLAMVEIQMILSFLLKRFKFVPIKKEHDILPHIIIKSKKPLMFKVEKR